MNYYSRNPNVKREVLRMAQERALQQTKNIPLNEVLVNRFYGGVYSGRGKQPEPEIIEEEIFGAGEKNTDLGDIKKVLEEIKTQLSTRPTQAPTQAQRQPQRQAPKPQKPKIDLSGVSKKMMNEAQILMDWMKAQLFTTTDVNTQIFYLDQWITQLNQQENSGRIIISGYNYNQPAINVNDMQQANKLISFLVKILDAWKLQLNQNFESAWSTIYNFRVVNKSTYPKWVRDRYQQMLKDYEQQQKSSGSSGGILGAIGLGQGEKDKEDEKLAMEVKGLKDKQKKMKKGSGQGEKDKEDEKLAMEVKGLKDKEKSEGSGQGEKDKEDEKLAMEIKGLKKGISSLKNPGEYEGQAPQDKQKKIPKLTEKDKDKVAKDINKIEEKTAKLLNKKKKLSEKDVEKVLRGTQLGKQMKNDKLKGEGFGDFLEGVKEGFSKVAKPVVKAIRTVKGIAAPFVRPLMSADPRLAAIMGASDALYGTEDTYGDDDVFFSLDGMGKGKNEKLEGKGLTEDGQRFVDYVIEFVESLLSNKPARLADLRERLVNKKNSSYFRDYTLDVGGVRYEFPNVENLKEAIDKILKGISTVGRGKGKNEKIIKTLIGKDMYENKKLPVRGGKSFFEREWKKLIETGLKNKSKEGKGKKGSSSRMKKRGEMIKKIMKEKNMSLGEASKYIKQNNLL